MSFNSRPERDAQRLANEVMSGTIHMSCVARKENGGYYVVDRRCAEKVSEFVWGRHGVPLLA
jgi:hypothetical protein